MGLKETNCRVKLPLEVCKVAEIAFLQPKYPRKRYFEDFAIKFSFPGVRLRTKQVHPKTWITEGEYYICRRWNRVWQLSESCSVLGTVRWRSQRDKGQATRATSKVWWPEDVASAFTCGVRMEGNVSLLDPWSGSTSLLQWWCGSTVRSIWTWQRWWWWRWEGKKSPLTMANHHLLHGKEHQKGMDRYPNVAR